MSVAPDRYRFKYLIAITVSLASVLELLDTSIVNVAIPHMMGNLGATLDQIAWVSTGYIVANVIILPITGWLSAFFGRRRYFAGSIALFTVASFMCGNAHSLEALVFWRIFWRPSAAPHASFRTWLISRSPVAAAPKLPRTRDRLTAPSRANGAEELGRLHVRASVSRRQ
jgi:MFS family permease